MRSLVFVVFVCLVLQIPIIAFAQSGDSSAEIGMSLIKQEVASDQVKPESKNNTFEILFVAGWFFSLGYAVNKWVRWTKGFARGRAQFRDIKGAVFWTIVSFGILALGGLLKMVLV